MNPADYNITINPVGLTGAAAARYTQEVREHLTWIDRTKSGRLLLTCIRRPTFPVEIRPYVASGNALNQRCNARGGSEIRGGVLQGTVQYTPGVFARSGACAGHPIGENRGRIADEILFHELIHVFRVATDKWDETPPFSIGMTHYTNNEEFVAVLCTNIYVSDRTNKFKSGLRAGHAGFSAMAPDDAKRFGLYASSRATLGLVKKFCTDHPIFTKALSDKLADVEYNPIADYYRYPKICEMLSSVGSSKDMVKLTAAFVAAGAPPEAAARMAAILTLY